MTTTSASRDATTQLLGADLHYLKGGSGHPAWVLHRDIGNPGWLPFHERLAERSTVTAPDLPGFGKSERLDWMMSVRDEAVALGFLLDRMETEPVTLVGLGFGGWVAAELATMQPSRIRRLVLVSPMGIKPREGEIYDQFLVSHSEYVLRGFHEPTKAHELWGEVFDADQLVEWDLGREMIARIAWKPYLFSLALPYLLQELEIPTLVAWGQQDAIVPPSTGQEWVEALPDARLELVDGAGHYVEMEQPDRLAELINAFVATG